LESRKQQARELILYLIVGVATTVVYFVTRFSVYKVSKAAVFSVLIAQIVSITFAFFANKFIVFNDKDNKKSLLSQFVTFALGRLFILVLDLVITFIFVDKFADFFIHLFRFDTINYAKGIYSMSPFSTYIGNAKTLNQFVWAMVSQVAAIVINYIISKFFVFNKKGDSINE
jgi:putative flippase GtrA